jgi:hypothetical protein
MSQVRILLRLPHQDAGVSVSRGCHDRASPCPVDRRFVWTWLDYCADPRGLTDHPNELGPPDLPGFIEHRHDQSVLSVLYWRERASLDHVLLGWAVKRQYLWRLGLR